MSAKILNIALVALALLVSYMRGRNAGLQIAIDIIQESIDANRAAQMEATP